jgi:hypothetical protein
MLYYIKKIVSIHDYAISCLFNTGEVRVIDLKDTVEKYKHINDGLISELVDKEYFKSVQVDSYGTLHWNNGVDFDTDNLYKSSKILIASI